MKLSLIKNLRALTGAGIMDCKQALQESKYDELQALKWLKKKGLALAQKKSLRVAKQGRVASYLHNRGRIGVLVEVNVETDFAAEAEDFKTFVHQLCLHITALNPLFIQSQDISKERLEEEKSIFQEQIKNQNHPSHVRDRIIKGKLNKWFKEVCLMDQIFLSSSQDEKPQTVKEVLTSLIAKLGENIIIRRYVRFELGDKNNLVVCS